MWIVFRCRTTHRTASDTRSQSVWTVVSGDTAGEVGVLCRWKRKVMSEQITGREWPNMGQAERVNAGSANAGPQLVLARNAR